MFQHTRALNVHTHTLTHITIINAILAIHLCIVKCHGFTRINGTFSVISIAGSMINKCAQEESLWRTFIGHQQSHFSRNYFVLCAMVTISTRIGIYMCLFYLFLCLHGPLLWLSQNDYLEASRRQQKKAHTHTHCLKCILITHNIGKNSFAIQYNHINSYKFCFI